MLEDMLVIWGSIMQFPKKYRKHTILSHKNSLKVNKQRLLPSKQIQKCDIWWLLNYLKLQLQHQIGYQQRDFEFYLVQIF